MKKIFSLLFILSFACAGLLAQSFTLYTHSGSVIPNGGTVGVLRTLYDTTTDVATEIDLKNISNSSQTYKVIRTVKILPGAQKTNFCFSVGCFPDTTNISPLTLTLDAGIKDNSFSSHISPNAISGSALVYYKFFNIKDNTDTVGIYIQSEVWHLGIENLSNAQADLGNVFPNPANEKFTVEYTVANEGQAGVVIRNMLGTTIREQAVPSGNGKVQVNTADLPEGIYFCSLFIDGKSVSTRKLVIRH